MSDIHFHLGRTGQNILEKKRVQAGVLPQEFVN